jgi:hypothetical protein
VGVEVASLGVQVHGGMGFIEETGAAQHYRDARIAPIYEGTNGIQAIDLIGRKVRLDQGAAMRGLCSEMTLSAQTLADAPGLEPLGIRLAMGVVALERATAWLVAADQAAALAAATPYLKLAGDVIGGWSLARQASVAADAGDPSAETRAALGRLYAAQVLSATPGLAEGMREGAGDLAATSAASLAG